MLKKRVIPILQLNNDELVKSIKYKNHKYVGDPINTVKIFNDKEVDELVIIDISVTKENKEIDFESVNSFEFTNSNIKTGGYGILDVAYRNKEELWVACGGGTLYKSLDGGKSWEKQDNEKLAANLYKIKFFNSKLGFALGSNGVLLKYKAE